MLQYYVLFSNVFHPLQMYDLKSLIEVQVYSKTFSVHVQVNILDVNHCWGTNLKKYTAVRLKTTALCNVNVTFVWSGIPSNAMRLCQWSNIRKYFMTSYNRNFTKFFLKF